MKADTYNKFRSMLL